MLDPRYLILRYTPECTPKYVRLDCAISLLFTLNGYSYDDCTNDDC
jgi:hypothetical protein